MRKEAILYVHGSDCIVKNDALNRLMDSFTNANTFADIEISDTIDKNTGEQVKKVRVNYYGSDVQKEFYVYEVFWGDLKVTFDEQRPLQRFIKSSGLILYWLFSKIWGGVFTTPKLAFPMIISMALMITWNISLSLMLVGELKTFIAEKYPDFLADEKVHRIIEFITTWGIIESIIDFSWIFWGVSTLILALFPVGKIVAMAHFVRNYLQDKSLRSNLRERIITAFKNLDNDIEFDRVLVLAHSFGSVITTEFLSHHQIPIQQSNLRVITLGAAFRFVSYRENWVKQMLFKAQSYPGIQSWKDYFSHKDWLCTRSPKTSETNTFESIELDHPVPLKEQVNGTSHQMYFEEEEVLKDILSA
ncbi:MAG: hypothetical protein CL843_14395 [Crocinitomicaceae bacterium]|nr:hypothetical protein [Crocinitomicaceae bacterium]